MDNRSFAVKTISKSQQTRLENEREVNILQKLKGTDFIVHLEVIALPMNTKDWSLALSISVSVSCMGT